MKVTYLTLILDNEMMPSDSINWSLQQFSEWLKEQKDIIIDYEFERDVEDETYE